MLKTLVGLACLKCSEQISALSENRDLTGTEHGVGSNGRDRNARDISKEAKARLLRALSKKLERARLHSGYIRRILHARVPILKFTWAGSSARPTQ